MSRTCGPFQRLFPAAIIAGSALALVPASALAQRPLGVDVSHYQGSIDWTSAKNSGVSFAWAKATEGSGTPDTYFASNMNNAKSAGVYIGAYHFARPASNSPATEASYFWSVAGGYIKNDGLTVQPVLDFEDFTATGGIPVGATSYSDWANQWCNAVVSLAAAAGVTVKPILYTSTCLAAAAGVTVKPILYTSTCLAGNFNSSVAQWAPWIANPSGLPAQTGSPWSSTSCSSSNYELWGPDVWQVWQYTWTATVPGISSQCDMDVFNGTSNQMVAALVIGTNAPLPFVTLTPQLDRMVDTGTSVTFTGTASGAPPLAYQWLLNGTPVAGATTNNILIASATTNNAGSYSLVVTNNSGSVTSSIVRLAVYPPQATVFADSFDTNSAANWIVNKSSSDTAITFSYDYSALGIPSAPHSSGGTTRGVQMKANLSLGVVAALSMSPTNQSFGGDYRLHFDGWINVNGPFPAGGSGSTEFLTAGIGTAGNRTEWTGSGSTADGFYFTADGDGGVSAASTTSGDYSGYRGTVWQNAASGIYAAGSLDNTGSYYTAAFPTGQTAPALQQSNYPQQTGALASGTFGLAWHDVIVSRQGSTVDWAVDGIRIATLTNVSFTASNVCVGFWDPFASLSSNNVINFGLVDNVRVEVPAIGPMVSVQPQSQTVFLGTNVTFNLAATGLPAPSYQWQFNGTNLPGATNSSYLIASVTTADMGKYSATVTNVAGSVTSSNAVLALRPPAAAQFQSIAVLTNHDVEIGFTGDAVWTYTVETSTNLTTWTPLTNLTSATGLFDFTAGSTTNDPARFYRARVGP